MSDLILVVCEIEGDALAPVTLEMVAAAKAHAATTGRPVAAGIAGPAGASALAPELFARGVSDVRVIEHPALDGSGAEARIRAFEALCREAKPQLVLVGQTALGRDLAPALAQRLGGGVVMNGIAIRESAAGAIEVTCPVFGGAAQAIYRLGTAGPGVVGLRPRLTDPAPAVTGMTGTVSTIEARFLDGFKERTTVRRRSVTDGPRLEDARVIVAGGLGLGDKSNFAMVEELALALGGLPAASRPVVDRGWVTSSLQVGLTGKVVAPELYFAIGISGASQHLAGMSGAKAIVAVNSDGRATIFSYAKYGVVADCIAFLPAFIDACRKLPPRN